MSRYAMARRPRKQRSRPRARSRHQGRAIQIQSKPHSGNQM